MVQFFAISEILQLWTHFVWILVQWDDAIPRNGGVLVWECWQFPIHCNRVVNVERNISQKRLENFLFFSESRRMFGYSPKPLRQRPFCCRRCLCCRVAREETNNFPSHVAISHHHVALMKQMPPRLKETFVTLSCALCSFVDKDGWTLASK